MLNLKTMFAAIIFSVASTLCAQELPWPTDPEGDEYRVDSAYGPRDVTEGTFFHKGIDLNEQGTSLNEDINQPIIAAANGAIFGIGRTSNGIHWIGVDYGNNRTFAYLHIFPNNSIISSGNFSDVVTNTIVQNNEIRSCRRVYTDVEEDANRGVILFYSGLNNTGRIVKALGINNVHDGWEQVHTDDLQIVAVNDPNPTVSATTIVVSAGTNGVIETMLRGDDYILGNNIVAGTNLRADSIANHVFPQTSVVAGEIIAPLGTSGATNAHLHLQISHADEALNNTKGGVGPNDGWDNVVQYLQRVHLDHTPYSGGISIPAAGTVLYHTDSHDNERVKARIRWRPEGENPETYHQYELDRVRIFAVPSEIVGTAADFIADNTYLINRDRAPTTGVTTQPNSSDAFRSEFNYGGIYSASNNIPFDNAFPPFIANTNVAYRSNGIKTGLNPLGQLETYPITEFVFNQWNTRINKTFNGLASINSEAAYPDGEYKLFAVAESVDRDNAELFISTSTNFIRNFLVSLVGNHTFAFLQNPVINCVKFTNGTFTADRVQGEDPLLCGVRQPAASRSAIAARTPRSGAAYARRLALCPPLARLASARQARPDGDRTIAARAATRRPIGGAAPAAQGLPQDARVAGGPPKADGLPRSQDADFFFFRPARKEFKSKTEIIAVLAANTANRIIHCDGETKNTGENYYV